MAFGPGDGEIEFAEFEAVMGRWIREKLSESLAAALEPPDLGGWSARMTFDRIECDAPALSRSWSRS